MLIWRSGHALIKKPVARLRSDTANEILFSHFVSISPKRWFRLLHLKRGIPFLFLQANVNAQESELQPNQNFLTIKQFKHWLERILTMVYVVQNYLVPFGLCLSSDPHTRRLTESKRSQIVPVQVLLFIQIVRPFDASTLRNSWLLRKRHSTVDP
jgi:hypothetical protein